MISSADNIQADMNIKRIVPFVSPRLTTVLPKDVKSLKSPWFDKQRHIQLRDNITKEQREDTQKQIRTLYWNPQRAARLEVDINERLDELKDNIGKRFEDQNPSSLNSQ